MDLPTAEALVAATATAQERAQRSYDEAKTRGASDRELRLLQASLNGKNHEASRARAALAEQQPRN